MPGQKTQLVRNIPSTLILIETAIQSQNSKVPTMSRNAAELLKISTASSVSSRSNSIDNLNEPFGLSQTQDYNSQSTNGSKAKSSAKILTKKSIQKKNNNPLAQSYNFNPDTIIPARKIIVNSIKFGSCRGSVSDNLDHKENIQDTSAVRLLKKRESLSRHKSGKTESNLAAQVRSSAKKKKDLNVLRRSSGSSQMEEILETPLGYHSNSLSGVYYSQKSNQIANESRNESRKTNFIVTDSSATPGITSFDIPVSYVTIDKRMNQTSKQIGALFAQTSQSLGVEGSLTQRHPKTTTKSSSSVQGSSINSKKSLGNPSAGQYSVQTNLFNRFNECDNEHQDKYSVGLNPGNTTQNSNGQAVKTLAESSQLLVEKVFKKRQEVKKAGAKSSLNSIIQQRETSQIKESQKTKTSIIQKAEKQFEQVNTTSTRNQPRLGVNQPKKGTLLTSVKKNGSYDYQIFSDEKSRRMLQTNVTNSLLLSPSPYLLSQYGKQTPQFTQTQTIKVNYDNMRKSSDTIQFLKQLQNPLAPAAAQDSNSLIRIEETNPNDYECENDGNLESFLVDSQQNSLFKNSRKTLVYPYLSKKMTSASLEKLPEGMSSCVSLIDKQISPRFGLSGKESLLQQANHHKIQNSKGERMGSNDSKTRFILNCVNNSKVLEASVAVFKHDDQSRNLLGHNLSNLHTSFNKISEHLMALGKNTSQQNLINLDSSRQRLSNLKVLKTSSSLERVETGYDNPKAHISKESDSQKGSQFMRNHRNSSQKSKVRLNSARRMNQNSRSIDAYQPFQNHRNSQCTSSLIKGLVISTEKSEKKKKLVSEAEKKVIADSPIKKSPKASMSLCKSPIGFKKNLHYNQPKLIKRDKSHLIRILYHAVKFMNVDTLIKLAQTGKKFSKTKEIKFILNQQFRTLVVKGLSTIDRVKYWNYRTRFVYYRKKYKNLYQKIISEKKSEYTTDIQKDLDRTFPQLKHFTKGNVGQDQLERLLTAISIYYRKLGYVQGMNFIVGTVQMSFQNEEDAFWMMISMLVNFKLDQLLTFENNKFRIICYQIDMFVKAYLPNLYEIFKENELSSEFYASQWLFTFFSIDLPFDIVYIAIDLFLLEGYSALIRICLTLLKMIESKLSELCYDESLVYLKTFGRHLETDTEEFFKTAMKFKISKQMCKDLEQNYQQEKGPSEMVFDQANQKWVLVSPVTDEQTAASLQSSLEEQKTGGIVESSLLNKVSSPRQYNAMNVIGNRVKNLFKWFSKGKPKDGEDSEEEGRSDEIDSNEEELGGKSSHRSADIEEQVAPLECLIATPHSQQIKTLNLTQGIAVQIVHQNAVILNSHLQPSDAQENLLNEISMTSDIIEGVNRMTSGSVVTSHPIPSKCKDRGLSQSKRMNQAALIQASLHQPKTSVTRQREQKLNQGGGPGQKKPVLPLNKFQ